MIAEPRRSISKGGTAGNHCGLDVAGGGWRHGNRGTTAVLPRWKRLQGGHRGLSLLMTPCDGSEAVAVDEGAGRPLRCHLLTKLWNSNRQCRGRPRDHCRGQRRGTVEGATGMDKLAGRLLGLPPHALPASPLSPF